MQKKILPKSGESCSDLVIDRHVAHLYSILKKQQQKNAISNCEKKTSP